MLICITGVGTDFIGGIYDEFFCGHDVCGRFRIGAMLKEAN